jgi:hypothetical protein
MLKSIMHGAGDDHIIYRMNERTNELKEMSSAVPYGHGSDGDLGIGEAAGEDDEHRHVPDLEAEHDGGGEGEPGEWPEPPERVPREAVPPSSPAACASATAQDVAS